MKVSNCCGASGNKQVPNWDVPGVTFKDLEICDECGEHCEYVEANEVTVIKEEQIEIKQT